MHFVVPPSQRGTLIEKEHEKDETKLTSGKIIKRNAPPNPKVNNNYIQAIDCDKGVINREHRFDDCLNAKRSCHDDELLVLKDLIDTGTSIDIFYTLKNDPAKFTMDSDGNIYRAHCATVNVSTLNSHY